MDTWPALAVLRVLLPQESRNGASVGFLRAHASGLSVGRWAGICGNSSACSLVGSQAAGDTWL